MSGRIDRRLGPVRRRLRLAWAMQGAAWGLLVGAAVAGMVGVARWVDGGPSWPLVGAAMLATCPALGALLGACRLGARRASARAVDAAYRLKDRTLSALEFQRKADGSPLHGLQLIDAMAHLDGVEPGRAIPLRVPRSLPYAVAAAAVAGLLLLLPLGPGPAEAAPAPVPDYILAEAQRVAADLEELRELAREEREEGLEQLVEQLLEQAEQLEQPGTDLKEFLATVSEMQAALAAQQAQYNVALVDAQLHSLGEALSVGQPFATAGQSLQQADFDKAAEQLEAIEEPALDRKEARALGEQLEKVARAMNDAGLGQLGASVAELVDSIEEGQSGRIAGTCDAIGKAVGEHARRKKLGLTLAAQVDRFSECKGNCQRNSLVRGNRPSKTNSPSQSFGLATSGNAPGDPTSLGADRRREEITGTQGEGPSDVEVSHAPEGRQVATRAYREAYEKHRKLNEAVLESEPIPLGHRETIRTYFELIRPQAGDEPDAAGSPSDGD